METFQFLQVLSILEKEYPTWNAPVVTLMAETTKDPYRVLISTLLSLRTRDEQTAVAVEKLFKLATTPTQMLTLSLETVEKSIFSTGFYKQKAKTILDVSNRIVYEFDGIVPANKETLMSFNGVGLKTSNLVLALGFNIPAICVDIHVHRICNRLGFIKTKTPEESEKTLSEKLTDKSTWNNINHLLVAFGQTICRPLSPHCSTCPVNHLCAKVGITKTR